MAELFASFTAVCIESSGPIVIELSILSDVAFYSAETAEDVLNETNVDLVDIGKGALINPNWANDAKEGKDTGKCLSCAKCMWFGQSKACPGKVIFERNNTQQ